MMSCIERAVPRRNRRNVAIASTERQGGQMGERAGMWLDDYPTDDSCVPAKSLKEEQFPPHERRSTR